MNVNVLCFKGQKLFCFSFKQLKQFCLSPEQYLTNIATNCYQSLQKMLSNITQ